jgi:hypothetical protein
MTAKEQRRYKEYQSLRREGVLLRKPVQACTILFNSGSETTPHRVAKTLCAEAMNNAGWVVDAEIEMQDGEADLIAWGRRDYPTWCIEIETDPPEGVVNDYLEQYVHNTPIDDLCVLRIEDMPNEMDAALGWVEQQLPVQV